MTLAGCSSCSRTLKVRLLLGWRIAVHWSRARVCKGVGLGSERLLRSGAVVSYSSRVLVFIVLGVRSGVVRHGILFPA